MFDPKAIWKERVGRTSKGLGKYLRYILNGHFVIVLVFLLGSASYYYQGWVKTLSPEFPVGTVMAILLAVFVTYSPIYTFLLNPDRIFLLPLESRLRSYFSRSILLSFFIQVYLLLVGLAVMMPMYAQLNQGDFQSFFRFLVVICMAKILNLLIRWNVQFFVDTRIYLIDSILRYCINAVFLFFLFSNASLIFYGLVLLILLILLLYYQRQMKEKGLNWDLLIDLEERRLMSFYRLANLFTDVPKLKDRVKRRKWLDPIVNRIPFGYEQSYLHLFVRTFFRGGDYLGLFVRLSLIGVAILYFIAFGFGQLVVVLLFLYLTGFQLLPLWNHHQNKIWIQLYPVPEMVKEKAFKTLLVRVLCIQTVVLSLPLLVKNDWLTAFLSIGAGLAFSYSFVYFYSLKKIRKV